MKRKAPPPGSCMDPPIPAFHLTVMEATAGPGEVGISVKNKSKKSLFGHKRFFVLFYWGQW